MKIQLRYFASVRETLGASAETLELPAAVASIGQLRAHLRERGGAWSEALAPGRALRMARNQHMAGDDAALADGDEIAFFPPVTGG
jgi:molybdopterin synthase sulfur carrier subunit